MSVTKTTQDIKLQVRVEGESTASGTAKIKNLNFNRIKLTATDAELYAAGQAISELQTLPLSGIRLVSSQDLTNEE